MKDEINQLINAIGDIIKQIYKLCSTDQAISKISQIQEELEKCSELAAARSQLLLGKKDPPVLADIPEWFLQKKANLIESEIENNEIPPPWWIWKQAELLVRAIPNLDENTEVELDIGPLGQLIIIWYNQYGKLEWDLDTPKCSWPSIKIFQLQELVGESIPKTRIIYNAFDAIEQFHKYTLGK